MAQESYRVPEDLERAIRWHDGFKGFKHTEQPCADLELVFEEKNFLTPTLFETIRYEGYNCAGVYKDDEVIQVLIIAQ